MDEEARLTGVSMLQTCYNKKHYVRFEEHKIKESLYI